jgi:anti-sigma B factor antagonist
VANVAQFRLSNVRLAPCAALVAVEGELDVYTAPELAELLQGIDDEVTHVLVDLTGVTFIDSAGLALLTERARKLRAHDGMMMLAIDAVGVRRIFELTGLARYFTLHQDPAEAAHELLGSALLGAS